MSYLRKITAACDFLKNRIPGFDASIAVALGSGLQAFGGGLENATFIPYTDIPHFPVGTVKGHKGKLIHGYFQGQQVLVFQGRAHLYEGFSAEDVTFYVRLLQFLGVKNFIVTNAAGGVNENYRTGDFMVIKDQINLFPTNSHVGVNDERLGPRFIDMSEAYDGKLSELLFRAARATEGQHGTRRGVYAGILGPNFETAAEVKWIRTIGADVVGMSTTLEVMAAKHGGLKVGGLSLVTNMGTGIGGQGSQEHDKVIEIARMRADTFVLILNKFFSMYFNSAKL